MTSPPPARKVVVTLSEDERWHGRSAAAALLDVFRRRGLWGATATRASAGFTAGGAVATENVVDLSASLPVRVEAWGTAEAVERALPDVYDVVERGIVEVVETRAQVLGAPEARPSGKEELVRLVGKAKMLRIHVGQDDTWEGEPLYEAIVKRARQLDVAGATVYRGILGYGAHKRLHKHKALALSHDDPILVSVVDEEEKIDRLLAALEGIVTGGCLIAISDVTVVKYLPHATADEAAAPAPAPPGDPA